MQTAAIQSSTGNRADDLIAIKFAVRERDLASTVAEAQKAVDPLISAPYSTTWSGEFQQMQEAEHRMLGTVIVAFALILVMLYLAFFSVRDAVVVYVNVLAMCLGGVWALLFAGLNFNISAAVGFISILGVVVGGMMMTLLLFNLVIWSRCCIHITVTENHRT